MANPLHILFIGAHPDDAESSAGGTLARFARKGHRVRMLSVTNGDAGHFAAEYIEDRSRLAARRRGEAAAAAACIGAESGDLDVHDGEVIVDLESTRKVVRAIRSFGPPGHGPDLIITHRPVDYHRDHRYTSRLVLDSAYVLTVPLFCPETPFLKRDPVIVYHADHFSEGGVFRPDVLVNTEEYMKDKACMLAAHVSQFFEWLPFNGGRLHEVPADDAGRLELMNSRVAQRGKALCDLARRAGVRAGDSEHCTCAELFQVSEYGRQPSDSDLRELFLIDG